MNIRIFFQDKWGVHDKFTTMKMGPDAIPGGEHSKKEFDRFDRVISKFMQKERKSLPKIHLLSGKAFSQQSNCFHVRYVRLGKTLVVEPEVPLYSIGCIIEEMMVSLDIEFKDGDEIYINTCGFRVIRKYDCISNDSIIPHKILDANACNELMEDFNSYFMIDETTEEDPEHLSVRVDDGQETIMKICDFEKHDLTKVKPFQTVVIELLVQKKRVKRVREEVSDEEESDDESDDDEGESSKKRSRKA